MPQKVVSILLLCVSFNIAYGQAVNKTQCKKVLIKGCVDSTYTFGKWTQDGQTETHLKYLGQVVTKSGNAFKLINSVFFWGLSHRATSTILIFDSKNQYVGCYLSHTSDLPTRIKNGNLIFENLANDCDSTLTTIVDLKNGLPRQFFRKCKGKLGDLYRFEKMYED